MSADAVDPVEEFDADLEAELAASESLFHEELVSLFRAPSDLLDRTRCDVESALLGRSTLLAAVDLLAGGWHTARLIFGSTNTQQNEESE